MSATLVQRPDSFARIRAALYSQPWWMAENDLKMMLGIFETHATGGTVEWEAKAKKQEDDEEKEDDSIDLGFDYQDDVATINIRGPIIPRATWFSKMSGMTSIDQLSAELDVACSLNPSCIIFNIDSPGGSVMGAKDFCNEISEASSVNSFPIISIANPMQASLASMIASVCDQCYATEGAFIGSYGTVMAMDNWDRAEKNLGNDPIVLRSSELKGIGSGGGITPNQTQEMTRMLGMWNDMFKQTVKAGRPNVDIDNIFNGQMWHAKSFNNEPSAQDMGFIDGITTLQKLQQQYAR